MKIILDYREKELIVLLKNKLENEVTVLNDIIIESERLDIGDIIIRDNNDVDILIIERKSIRDLMSSIKDGRYKEQSLRLNCSNLHNHNIIYLIEGITSGYGYIEDPRVDIKTVYSCICSLMFYKGFSILRASNKNESADIILRFADKINRDKNEFYYNLSNESINSNLKMETELYSSTIRKVKSENINKDNIGEIMLSQIPKISANIAHEIMLKYHTIKNILASYEENNNLFEEFTYTNSKNQEKKLTKPAIENIKSYLCMN